MATIEEVRKLLDEALKPINENLLGLRRDVDALRGDMANLRTDVRILATKQRNSTLGVHDQLGVVPFSNGRMPPRQDYPFSLAHLLVAGNEALPGVPAAAERWNARKSKKLLKMYERDSADVSDASDASDGEGQQGLDNLRERRLRIRVAALVGVNQTQLAYHYQLLEGPGNI